MCYSQKLKSDLKVNIDGDYDSLKKLIKATSYTKPSDKEISTIDRVQSSFKQAEDLLEEKSTMADRSLALVRKLEKELDCVKQTTGREGQEVE